MTKIVITNHGSRLNKGNAALLNSRIRTLKELIPNAEFTIFTYHPEKNYAPEMKYIPEILARFYEVPCKISLSPRELPRTIVSILKLIFCNTKLVKILNMANIKEYMDADVIITTGGDVLTEDYGSISFFNYVANLLLGILLKKPVVIYAESIGPFKRRWNRIIAKFLLNRVSLITLRENISKGYLNELNISNVPIYITADSSFLLEPAPFQRIKEILKREGIGKGNSPLIGISVSKIISYYGFPRIKSPEDKYNKYVIIMAHIVDYLIEKLGATVVFIPHVIGPGSNDDRIVADDILNLVKNKEKIVNVRNEYSTEEVRGIIGQCDIFIGARMHATISSISMHVPAVAIAYSHKTYGIIGEMLGYKEYVIDIRKGLKYDTLISVIDKVWNNRTKIREELESRIKDIKKRALLNGELIKKLIKSSS